MSAGRRENTGRRILDDIAGIATAAAGVIQGASREAEAVVRQRLEAIMNRMDLIPRDEFEVVEAMASAARKENERLTARIEALEKKTFGDVQTPAEKKAACAAKPKAAAKKKTAAEAKVPAKAKAPGKKKAAAKANSPAKKKTSAKKKAATKAQAKPAAAKK